MYTYDSYYVYMNLSLGVMTIPLNIGTSSSLLWPMTNFSFLLRRASSSVVMMVAFVRLDKWRGCFEMYWSWWMSMLARAQSFLMMLKNALKWSYRSGWMIRILPYCLVGKKPWNLQICRENLKIEAFYCLGLLRLPSGFPSFFLVEFLLMWIEIMGVTCYTHD